MNNIMLDSFVKSAQDKMQTILTQKNVIFVVV